jgi:hypothetical protein
MNIHIEKVQKKDAEKSLQFDKEISKVEEDSDFVHYIWRPKLAL